MKTFLLSAYACEPEKGSEPGVGWNWALELAKKHKVVVITRENNKQAIQQYLSRHSCANLSFAFCDLPSKLSFFKKGQKGLHLYYFLLPACKENDENHTGRLCDDGDVRELMASHVYALASMRFYLGAGWWRGRDPEATVV